MDIRLGNIDNNKKNDLNIVSILSKTTLFNDLNKSELRELAKIIYVRWYRNDETIFYDKEPGSGMYIIYKGSIKLIKNLSNNGNAQETTLQRGDFFGEISLLNEYPRTMTAIATGETCLLGIFRPDLLLLLKRKPRLGNKFLVKLNKLFTAHLQKKDDELNQIKEELSNSDYIR